MENNPILRGECGDCIYYHFDANQKSGQCRANPPTPFPVPAPGLDGQVHMQVVSMFPPVARDSYCGMFESESAAQIDPPPER